MKTKSVIGLVLFALALFATTAFAADAPAPNPVPAPTGLLLVIIPLLVPALIAALKFVTDIVPSWVLPILAPALGALADFLSSLMTGDAANPVMGAVLGGTGVAVREIVDQLKQKLTKNATP